MTGEAGKLTRWTSFMGFTSFHGLADHEVPMAPARPFELNL